MHEHVHVGGAGVQLLGAQEVEDGGEQGGVPVDENLQDERKDEKSVWSGRQSARKKIIPAGAYSSSFILQGGDPAAEQAGDTNIQLLALEVH